MALIDCPRCGNKISDRAKECPKCGMNLSLQKNHKEQALKALKQNELQVDEKEEISKLQDKETRKGETSKTNLKEEIETPKSIIKEINKDAEESEKRENDKPQKIKRSNKCWSGISFVIGIILGLILGLIFSYLISNDKNSSVKSNNVAVVGGTDSQGTEDDSNEKVNESGAALIFKYIDVSLIPDGSKTGTYKVGKDIEPGEYIAYGLYSKAQVKQFDSLDEQEDAEEIEGLFIGIKLKENQYIEVEDGILLPKNIFDTNKLTKYGVYKVGKDIDAGEYKVESVLDSYESSYDAVDGNLGACEIADEPFGGNVMQTIDLYDGQKYITLKNGQYIRIVDAALYKN